MPQFVTTLLGKPIFLGIIAVFILGGGYALYQGNGNGSDVLTIERGAFEETVSVTGTVVAAQNADLGFAGSGRISGVYASVGDRVFAGATLAAIENGDLVAAVIQKEAALETVEANLEALLEGTRSEQISIYESAVTKNEKALLDEIRSAYVSADDAVHKKADQFFINPRSTNAQITFTLLNGSLELELEQARVAIEPVLASWGARVVSPAFESAVPEDESFDAKQYLAQVSDFLKLASEALAQALTLNTTYQADIHTARTSVASAVSALSADEGALAGARGDLALAKAGTTAADIAAQIARVKAAEADVLAAKAALEKTIVRAPFTGIVSKMDVKKGEVVSANTSSISMISTGAFQLETFVPQINVSSVEPGDLARVTLDAYGLDVEFKASVISVDPAETIREGVATYKTVLAFDDVDTRIRSGMSANVDIITAVTEDVIVIPRGAVIFEEGDTYVVLKDKTRRAIEIRDTSSVGRVEVLRGLRSGDAILLTP